MGLQDFAIPGYREGASPGAEAKEAATRTPTVCFTNIFPRALTG